MNKMSNREKLDLILGTLCLLSFGYLTIITTSEGPSARQEAVGSNANRIGQLSTGSSGQFNSSRPSQGTSQETGPAPEAPQNNPNFDLATNEAIRIYKESGLTGLKSMVLDCYGTNRVSFFCLCFDLASRRIDQVVAESSGFPKDEFFEDTQFGQRVIPIFKSQNMTMEEANTALVFITEQVNRRIESKL